MNSVIGFFDSEAAVNPTVEWLKQAGVDAERISVISNPNAIRKLLGCDPACVVRNYIAWGVALGVGIYAIFGLAAAMCQCNLMQFGQEYGIGAFFGAVLAGMFVGGFLGALVGAGEAEKNTHLYVQGIRLGGKVISVQVQEEEVEQVEHILTIQNASGVKALQPESA